MYVYRATRRSLAREISRVRAENSTVSRSKIIIRTGISALLRASECGARACLHANRNRLAGMKRVFFFALVNGTRKRAYVLCNRREREERERIKNKGSRAWKRPVAMRGSRTTSPVILRKSVLSQRRISRRRAHSPVQVLRGTNETFLSLSLVAVSRVLHLPPPPSSLSSATRLFLVEIYSRARGRVLGRIYTRKDHNSAPYRESDRKRDATRDFFASRNEAGGRAIRGRREKEKGVR